MRRIGLLSDTHSFLDANLREHFSECDEIWHAGDLGSLEILDELNGWGKPVRAVWGNIDGHEVRVAVEKDLWFTCEQKLVFMTHIAGYPGRYNARVRHEISERRPGIVVCGHSHILKVMHDRTYDHLHINPGACGRHGFHKVRTAIRFSVDGDDIRDMQAIELGGR